MSEYFFFKQFSLVILNNSVQFQFEKQFYYKQSSFA